MKRAHGKGVVSVIDWSERADCIRGIQSRCAPLYTIGRCNSGNTGITFSTAFEPGLQVAGLLGGWFSGRLPARLFDDPKLGSACGNRRPRGMRLRALLPDAAGLIGHS